MASLDMSLDDMIKSRRSSERGRGQGRARRGRGRGPVGPFRGGRMTAAPHRGVFAKGLPSLNFGTGALTCSIVPIDMQWVKSPLLHIQSTSSSSNFPSSTLLVVLHFNLLDFAANVIGYSFLISDLLLENGELFLRAAGLTGAENGTKLYVSNLDVGVTNEDIRELFSEIGELKRYAVHYDRNGRSSGSAEVVFSRRTDAFQALKRYNNVQLDGRPMKIEIIGTNSKFLLQPVPRGRGRGTAAVSRGLGQRGRGGPRNFGARGRGGRGGRGRGREKAVEKSADELDKELDNYHAMQT
ncbi:hypothetical protein C3L33_18013, partial [Rhododendron williamsianum]